MKTSLPWLALLLALAPASFASAAPPVVNGFFPAGGQRGTTVEVAALGTFAPWPTQVWVDAPGLEVKPAKEAGKLLVAIAADATPGVYQLRLYNAEGASIARPFLVGTLPEIAEKEPNDDPLKPQVLNTSRVVVNGRLDKAKDVDVFSLKLKKGETLVASLEANRTLRSPMDGVLQILSADGFVLEQNDDWRGIDPQIAFPVPKDGVYLIRVFAFPAIPDATIGFAGGEKFIYRLTLTTGPFLESAFPLAVPQGSASKVELVGWNLTDELKMLPITPRAGAEILTLFHPSLASTFTLRQETHPVLTRASREPMMIPIPATISGRLQKPGDRDQYRFEAKKGQKFTFRVEARGLGFLLDPVLRVNDSQGKMLAEAKAAALDADPALDFTMAVDGKVSLEVRDLHDGAGLRHAYLLHAGFAAPDYDLKLASDRFVMASGKPLDIPVVLEPRGGFKSDLDLRVEGLPPGVTASTVAGPKTLTLKLVGESPPWSGPIRVVGVPKTKDAPQRPARAAVADLAATTESLWLTVTGKK
jgi:hypothetical protein